MTTNKILKWVITGGLFLIPFAPYMVAGTLGIPDLFFPFITSKAFFFRIIVEIIFAAWLVLAIRVPEYRPKFSWIGAIITVFVAFMWIVDMFFAVNPEKAIWSNFERMEGWVMIAHLWMYFVAMSSFFTTSEWWKKWFVSTLVASFLITVFAYTQLAVSTQFYTNHIKAGLTLKVPCANSTTPIPLGDCISVKYAIHQGNDRVDSTLGNAAYLAVYLLLHIFIALYMILHVGKWHHAKAWRISLSILAVLEFYILFSTATRGSLAALVFGAFVGMFIIILNAKEHPKLRMWSCIALAAAVLVIGGFWSVRNTDFVKSNYQLSRFSSVFSLDSVRQDARFAYLWPMAFKGIAERPILGWGQEGYNYIFNKYYDPGLYNKEQWYDRGHNVFLDWLISGGVIGFGLYVALYIVALAYVWRSKNFTIFDKAMFTAIIVGYAGHNMLVFDNISSYIIFFSLLAFIHSTETPHKKSFPSGVMQVDVQNLIATPIIVIVGLVSLYVVNIVPIEASKSLVGAITPQLSGPAQNLALFKQTFAYDTMGKQEAREQLYSVAEQIIRSTQAPVDLKNAYYEELLTEGNNQTKETPQDARGFFLMGTVLDHIGQTDVAYPYLVKALSLSQTKQTMMYEVAINLISQKKYDDAVALAEHAYTILPVNVEAKTFYATTLIYAGKTAEAMKLFDGALPLTESRIVTALEYTKQYKYLVSQYEAYVKANPSDVQARMTLAKEYVYIGDTASAIYNVQQIAKINPLYQKQVDDLVVQIRTGKFNVAQ